MPPTSSMSTDDTASGPGSHPAVTSDFSVDVPLLSFDTTRWSVTRQTSVEEMAKRWEEAPNTVLIFEDPKLGRSQLALLRKDALERTLAVLEDLRTGQAGLHVEAETVTKLAVSLSELVREMVPQDGDAADAKNERGGAVSAVLKILEVLVTSASRIETTLVRAHPTSPESSLSDDERAFLDALDDPDAR